MTAAIVVIVFFVVYQQLENHLLQPLIFSRTVQLNPLTVLLAILIGVELAGILGTLLAIPVAGIMQIVLRDIWDTRQGRLKPEPTVGTAKNRPEFAERYRLWSGLDVEAAVRVRAGGLNGRRLGHRVRATRSGPAPVRPFARKPG